MVLVCIHTWCLPYPTIMQLEQLFNNTVSSQDQYTLVKQFCIMSAPLAFTNVFLYLSLPCVPTHEYEEHQLTFV